MGGSSAATPRRPVRPARFGFLLLVLLLLAAVGSLIWHQTYAQWFPDGRPPPRLSACDRAYNRADPGRVGHPPQSELENSLGSYPPLSGAPIQAGRGCDGRIPTVIYLRHGDGFVSYGLSGGP